MSYVPHYKNDIFISYACVDDELSPGMHMGWVTTLIECIKTRLSQRLGRSDSYSLWMDHELAKHVNLTPQIMDAIRQTAILIIILSPGYLASDWCKREKNEFLKQIQEGDSRVFLIKRDVIEDDDRAGEFKDMRGFQFWVPDKQGKPPKILGYPEPDKDDHSYYSLIDEITFELVDELRRLKKKNEVPVGATIETRQQPIVYLAEVTDDLEQERTGVKTYLNQFGIDVLPNTWYSQDPVQFKHSVERDLEKCVVFVQLLSSYAGKKPPDLPQGYIHLQYELANTSQKPIPIFQWRSPSLDMASVLDESHRAFLFDGLTVRAEGIEDFKRTIKDYILAKPVSAPSKPLSAFVFVNMETADRPLAEKICSLLDRHGIGYSLPLDIGDPTDIRTDFEDNILESDGIIIIYGTSTKIWVRNQLMACKKILSRRDRQLQAFAVFEGPPEEKGSIDFILPSLQFFNFRKSFEDESLEKELVTFIRKLG